MFLTIERPSESYIGTHFTPFQLTSGKADAMELARVGIRLGAIGH